MKRIICVCAGILAVSAAVSAAEDVWHWRAEKKGTSYYLVSYPENWTNEIETITGTPPRGARVVIDAAGVSTSNGEHPPWGEVNWISGSASQFFLCVTSGAPIKVRCAPFATSGLYLYGDGETFIDSDRDLKFQKAFKAMEGSPTFVKKGPWSLTCFYEGNSRDYTFPLTKLQEGTLNISTYKVNENIEIRFDGPLQSRLEIGVSDYRGKTNLTFKSSALTESADAINSDHGVTSSYDLQLCFTGTPKVNPMVFTGKFLGSAGLQWKPDSSDYAFVLSNAVSTTTGRFYVSNGTVRVTSGAGFSALPLLVVAGANSRFEVDATAKGRMLATTVAISNGGKLVPMAGAYVSVAAVTTNGAAVADGVYHGSAGLAIGEEADWVDGQGVVVVGTPVAGTSTAATWNGAGGDTAATTLGNWNGAESLPDLVSGATSVSVTGGATFTADTDVFVQGLTVGVTPFTLAPAAGKTLWIGSDGITGNGGTVTVGGAGTVVAAAVQKWENGDGRIAVAGNVSAVGKAVTHIYHAGKNKSPTFANGVTVDGDILFVDGTKAKQGTTVITIPDNANITFNGQVLATNTSSISVSSGAGSTVTFNDLFMSRDGGGFSGSGTVVFNGPMHFRDRSAFSGGTVELHSTGNRLSGFMGTWSGGTLKTMVPYAINKTNTKRQPNGWDNNSGDGDQNTWLNLKDTCTIDLCGNDQSIDQLGMHADGTKSGGHITSATPATFHLQTVKSYWPSHCYTYGFSDYSSISSANSYGYETADKGYWEGAVNLSYEAANGMVRSMMRQSPSTGRVEVVSGTLVFLRRAATSGETFDLKGGSSNPYPRLANEDGGWTNATAVVVKGGTLELEHRNVFGPQTVVQFVKTSNAYGQIKLADGVRQRVFALEIDGVDQRRGTYGATGSGAQHVNDTLFAGGGTLSVVGDGMGMVILFR